MRRDVFQAIVDPVRREIIDLLSAEEMNVSSLTEHFPISQQAISKHIKILEECNVISITKQGRQRFCRINPQGLVPAYLWVEQFQRLWEERIDSFDNYLSELKAKQKDDGPQ